MADHMAAFLDLHDDTLNEMLDYCHEAGIIFIRHKSEYKADTPEHTSRHIFIFNSPEDALAFKLKFS